MNTIETMRHIEKTLDKLYDMGDDALAQMDIPVMQQDLAVLNHYLQHARLLAHEIYDTLLMEESEEYADSLLAGEVVEESLDNFHEGEWGTTFPDMSEED